MAGERIQASFSIGEIAPELQARTDLEIFKQALKRCRNFIVNRLGSLSNRPGFRRVFGSFEKNTTKLIPFRFSNDEQYILVFGTTYKLSYAGFSPSSSDYVWPCYVLRGGTQVATFYHPYSTQDLPELRVTQVRDIMTIVHPRHHPQEVVRSAEDDWKMRPFPVDRDVFPPGVAGTSGETDAAPVAGYDRDWRWVVTSVNRDGQESLPSSEFTSPGDAGAGVQVNDTDAQSQWLSLTAPTVGDTPVEYNVYRGKNGYYGFVGSTDTAGADCFEDLGVAPSYGDGPPKANNPFLDAAEYEQVEQEGIFDASSVYVKAVGTIAPYDSKHVLSYRARVDEGNTISVLGEYRVGAGAWTPISTQVIQPTGYYISTEDDINQGPVYTYVTQYATFSMDCDVPALTAGDSFRMTISAGTGFLEPQTVTWTEQPGATADEWHYPSAVCLFEQRLVFGGFTDEPSRIVTSRTGDFRNFDTSDFVKDAESVELYLASGKMDEIHDIVPFRTMIVLTNSGEWSVAGADGPLTPSAFNVAPHTYNGSYRKVAGLPLDGEVFFVSPTGKTIKSITYSRERDALQSQQINVQCSHLFTGNVKSWAWSDEDNASIIWVVLDDGSLLSLTYMPDYEVAAWAKHETNGRVEDVATVIEAGRWQTYALIERPHYWTTAGTSVANSAVASGAVEVERLARRRDDDIRFGNYLDSSAVYSGINETPTRTMTPSNNDATNPSFETGDLTGWTTISSAAPAPIVVYTPAIARTGDYACYMNTFYTTFGPASGYTELQQSVVSVIGEDIEASFWFYPDTFVKPGAKIRLKIDDGSGSFTTVTEIDAGTLTPDTWVQISGSRTATGVSGRVRVSLEHVGWSTSLTQTGYIDDLVISAAGARMACSSAFFTSAMVGDRIHLRGNTPTQWPAIGSPLDSPTAKDDPWVFEITGYIDTMNVYVTPIGVPESVFGVATDVWSRARRNFTITDTPGDSALAHLQHQDVSFLGDGTPGTTHINYALDNPVTTETITFDLGRHAEFVILGYGYSSLIETLPIPEARNKKKLLSKLSMDVAYSRGFLAGPSDDQLTEKVVVDADDPYIPTLYTELMELQITQAWKKRGTIIVKHDDPTPFKIQSVSMEVTASAIP